MVHPATLSQRLLLPVRALVALAPSISKSEQPGQRAGISSASTFQPLTPIVKPGGDCSAETAFAAFSSRAPILPPSALRASRKVGSTSARAGTLMMCCGLTSNAGASMVLTPKTSPSTCRIVTVTCRNREQASVQARLLLLRQAHRPAPRRRLPRPHLPARASARAPVRRQVRRRRLLHLLRPARVHP